MKNTNVLSSTQPWRYYASSNLFPRRIQFHRGGAGARYAAGHALAVSPCLHHMTCNRCTTSRITSPSYCSRWQRCKMPILQPNSSLLLHLLSRYTESVFAFELFGCDFMITDRHALPPSRPQCDTLIPVCVCGRVMNFFTCRPELRVRLIEINDHPGNTRQPPYCRQAAATRITSTSSPPRRRTTRHLSVRSARYNSLRASQQSGTCSSGCVYTCSCQCSAAT